jgi:uncharacterized MAPEG superfamily protein
MTIAIFCILISALMPLACAAIAKSGTFKTPRKEGGYDNLDPRAWEDKQEGWRKWATNAQANSWEALPFFGMAVIVSHILGIIGWLPNTLAVTFIVLRSLYIYLYVTGKQSARSMVWMLALFVNIVLFLLPIFNY